MAYICQNAIVKHALAEDGQIDCSAAAVTCICLVFIWAGEQKSWHKELSEVYTSLPVPPITAVSPESSPISGTVTYHSSIVAPVQFQIVQDGPDAQMLRMDYMELRFPRLVKPVFKEYDEGSAAVEQR